MADSKTTPAPAKSGKRFAQVPFHARVGHGFEFYPAGAEVPAEVADKVGSHAVGPRKPGSKDDDGGE